MKLKEENMYFVIKPALVVWDNGINQAELEGSPVQTNPHWWASKSLTGSLPLFTFTVRHNAPMLDNFFTGTIFDLYSIELIALLSDAGVRFEEFPAIMLDRITRKVLDKPYKIFHLLERYYGVDPDLSDINDERAEINRLVLSRECLQLGRPLFRLAESDDITLVSQELKELLDSHNISGCKYVPIAEFHVGTRYYFEESNNKNERPKVD